MTRLRTDAWLLRGISSIPGELRLANGKLSFTCSVFGSAWPFQLRKLGVLLDQPSLAKALEEGKTFQLFQWSVEQVQSTVPWYYFGGGIKLRHQNVHLRFSFGRPTSGGHNLATAAADLKELGAMRSRGKLWSKALATAASRTTGEA
jgi:hypothetical protein